jgi:hypothetical protein
VIIPSSAKYALGVTVILAILAGCNSGSQSAYTPSSGLLSPADQSLYATAHTGPAAPRQNTAARPMLYISSWSSGTIFGYPSNHNGYANKKNAPPTCTFTAGVRGLEDIGGDAKGNLIVPSYDSTSHSHVLNIYGPDCGALIGSISDPYTGGIYDVASGNALTGKIVVATSGTYTGSVTVCTYKGGCTSNLSLPGGYSGQSAVFAVAVDRAGDCWAQGVYETYSRGDIYVLVYYKGCSGTGQIATGFLNKSKGGLDIDKDGNIVSIESGQGTNTHGSLYVYKGCNPACTVVGGPLALHGDAGEFYGHLDKGGNTFATMDFFVPQVNIYSYTPTALTYLYSFNNGMSACGDCTGAAYAPAITK